MPPLLGAEAEVAIDERVIGVRDQDSGLPFTFRRTIGLPNGDETIPLLIVTESRSYLAERVRRCW